MAVAFIGNVNGVATSATGSLTLNYTPGTGIDKILCATGGVHRSGRTMSSIVYDPIGENKPFTRFAGIANSYEASIWYLLNTDIINSAAKDIVFTPSGNSRMGVNAAEFTGVDQTTPLEDAQTATLASAISIVTPAIISAADDITIDRMFTEAAVNNLAADSGQTELQNANTNLGYAGCSYGDPAEPTMGWFWTNNRFCAIIGVNIKAAVGGGAGETFLATSLAGSNATGELSTGIELNTTASAFAIIESSLNVGITFAALASGSGFAISVLQTAIDFLAVTSASASAIAGVFSEINFQCEAQATVNVFSNLVNEVEFNATSSASAFCLADVLTAINLSAQATGSAIAKADLVGDLELRADSLSGAQIDANIQAGIDLTSAASAQSFALSDLQSAISFSAQAIATGSVTANISAQIILEATISIIGSASGALKTQINLAAEMLASGSISTDLFNGVIVAIILANEGDAFFATINDGNSEFSIKNEGDAFFQ